MLSLVVRWQQCKQQQELHVQNNIQSIIGPYVDKHTQENMEKLFNDVMFPEEDY